MRLSVCAGVVCVAAGVGAGQVLYEAANASASEDEAGEVMVVSAPPSIASVSLIAVEAPEPPSFLPNDLITIIISERSKTDREQTFDSKKQYDFGGSVETWVDMMSLLELRLEQGDRGTDGDDLARWALEHESRFKGDASYERDDTVTARVTARVIEVKPNGTLLLEARTTIRTDEEEQTITLAGLCRTDDVTDANTVQSNQMFDLRLDIQNDGDVRDGAEKGLIPKVLETLFNF